MFAIVGSGFGLYGYLPALAETFDEPILVPEAYRDKVEARPELWPYRSAIQWKPNAESALRAATAVVIATAPRKQLDIAAHCATLPTVRVLLLEKPLAPTPAQAQALKEMLSRRGKRFRIGYTFLNTRWAELLAASQLLAKETPVCIEWTFMAHHFASDLRNWKRMHEDGGGVLRFFGIHLIALLAYHGYRQVERCVLEGEAAAEPERWLAIFRGPGRPECRVRVDARCRNRQFRIDSQEPLVALADPYSEEQAGGTADRRVQVLKRYLASLREPDARFDSLYSDVNLLWARTEEALRANDR